MINRIGAVLIWSESWRKLADWYQNILGLAMDEELHLPDDTGRGFSIGDTYLWVGHHDEVRGKSKDKYRIMISFEVDSVENSFKKLKSRGVLFILEPTLSPTKEFYVATAVDPENNIIQFYGEK